MNTFMNNLIEKYSEEVFGVEVPSNEVIRYISNNYLLENGK